MVEFYSNRDDKVLDKLANYEHEQLIMVKLIIIKIKS